MLSSNEFRFKIWFPGLEDEKPAQLIWTASDAETAYSQLVEQYPDCSILCVPN